MRQFTLQITELAVFAGRLRVRCHAPQGAPGFQPGQAMLARLAGPGWRWPAFPLYAPGGLEFHLDALAEADRPASQAPGLEPGMELDAIGPVGRGFSLPPAGGHVLLVAPRLARLWPLLAGSLQRGCSVAILLAPDWPAPEAPPEVELLRGPLSKELAAWADLVALDVPDPQAWAASARRGTAQFLAAPLMPCGAGACQACGVEWAGRRRLACVDGPAMWTA